MKKGAAKYAKASLKAALINLEVEVGLEEPEEEEDCFPGRIMLEAMDEMAEDAGVKNKEEEDPNNCWRMDCVAALVAVHDMTAM